MKWTNVYGLDQLGSFLQKTRKEKGYTQDEFAEIIGASHATLSALENGKGVSCPDLMRAISDLGLKLVCSPGRSSRSARCLCVGGVASALAPRRGSTVNSETLEVRLGGEKIGQLARTKNGARFAFSEEVASAHPFSPLLSTALCVQEEPFDAQRTFSWFSGLLPEDARLDELQRFYGVAEGDYFGLLAQIGWECAGAVEVMPSEDWALARASQELPREKRLTPEELSARLAALPSHPYDDASSLRVSLGGFQEKLCVTARPEDWAAAEPGHRALSSAALPLDGAPSTHILKPQPQGRLAGLVEAEAWGMEVARHVTETAGSAILDLPDAPSTLVVERFDRVETERGLVRLHQEDCAQALGIEPGRKYAATATPTKSDPTYKGIAELLSRYAADSLEERKRLLRHLS